MAKGLDFMAGLRLDYGGYPKAQFNQKLFDEMGIRTDNQIKSFVIQPRFQFEWNVNEGNKDFLKFGAEFSLQISIIIWSSIIWCLMVIIWQRWMLILHKLV
ncbi:hypothetical protein [Chryseobacterium indoltheticum]|uniref:hypothetical protein n=1 Tax=Chryseobacterium indoltheticum TaxID=254 RepID=UPI003F498759